MPSEATIVAMAAATLIGTSLGVLGSGGSTLAIPVLVYLLHFDMAQAVAASLVVVGGSSLAGCIVQLRRGRVDWRVGLMFASTGMAGSYIGSGGTHLVPKTTLMLMFTVIMMIVGTLMLRGPLKAIPAEERRMARVLASGFGVGLLTGFLGVGGGFLIVPALALSAGLEMRMAAGTSLGVIALNSATGLLGQMRFVKIPWEALSVFLLFTLLGMMIGLTIAHRIQENMLRRVFGGALIAIALVLAGINLT